MKLAILALSLLLSPLAGRAASDLLGSKGGFEDATASWGIYVPDESKEKNCRFDIVSDAPHSGANCARFQSDDYARFSVGPKLIPVHAGDRYRVTVWVRADSSAHVRAKAAGFAVRLNLRQGNDDAEGGHLFISPGGKVTRNTPVESGAALPTAWTKIEAVIEIPAGVDTIGPSLFSWWSKGTFYVDDFSLEKVDASTPVTPLVQTAPMAVPGVVPAPTRPPVPGPVTADDVLLKALNLDAPGMEKVKAAAQPVNDQIDWSEVKAAFLDYRRTACPARWGIMPSDKPAQPQQKDDAAANRVLQHFIRNVYHFPMPAEVDMGKDFNWTYNPVPRNSPAYSAEWTFGPVGRFEFWNTLASAYWQTGEEKYAAGWVEQMQDFARKNPMHFEAEPGIPHLWRSLDSAIRIMNAWPNAYYHFLDSPSFTPDANWLYLKMNYEHAQVLVHALSDTNRTGNWVATECAALYVIGTLFPEFQDATAWRQQAIDRLTVELDRMVPPDGFEIELTPTYHFVSLDGFRRPLDVAKLNNQQIPEAFRSKVLAMYRAAVLVMDQAGNDVPTNDSKVLSAALQAEAGLKIGDDPLLAWAASHGQAGEAPPTATALPYAGFYAMRGGWKRDDLFLFFRSGPTGTGHQHEDMLEVVLRAWNKTLLFEPGGYSYDESDWRRFSNGTASHSTIIVDGKWQHRGANKPPVTTPTGEPWVTTPLFDYVAGTYDAGYQESVYRARPFDPQTWKGEPDKSVSHTRRVLFLPPNYALILDTLDGTGDHVFDAHFHLDAPAARIDPTTQAAFSKNTSGAQLALYPLERDNLTSEIVQGQKDPLLGWMPNDHRAIPTIRFRKKQAAPAIFATFLYPYKDNAPSFSATPLPVEGAGIWARQLKTALESAEVILLKSGTAASFTVKSPLLGDVAAEASGLVIRQPKSEGAVYVGGMDLRAFRTGQADLTLAQPAALIFSSQKDSLLCFNPGDQDLTLEVKQPFARSVTLPSKKWTAVSSGGDSPAPVPSLFAPLDSSSSGLSYGDYLKKFPEAAPAPTAAPIQVKAENMTLPGNAVLATKIGATGKVLARWDGANTSTKASFEVTQSGWYRVKVRYCSGESPIRTLLVDGKAPFSEAEGFPMAATIGTSPSDGWSNYTEDWREVVLGASPASPGWKIYLKKGPCTVELKNDGGGVNLDWLELDPA